MPLHNNLAPDRMRLLGKQWLVVGVLLCVTVNLLLLGVTQTLGRHGPAAEHGADLALIGCPWWPGLGRDQRPDPGRLRIATFNAEWLFDGVNDTSHVAWLTDPASAQAHLAQVAAEVAAVDADVMNLVEVEGCFMLQRLLAALPPAQRELFTPFLVKGTDSVTHQQAGLVSTLAPTGPLRRTEGQKTWPVPGSACGYSGEAKSTDVSKHWWGVWSVPGLSSELLVVGAHLKAFPTEPRSCARREAQASVLAELIQQEGSGAGRHVVLMGDLNDFDGEVPDAEGNVPTSAVLRMLSSGLGLHRSLSPPSPPQS